MFIGWSLEMSGDLCILFTRRINPKEKTKGGALSIIRVDLTIRLFVVSKLVVVSSFVQTETFPFPTFPSVSYSNSLAFTSGATCYGFS